MQIQDVYDLMMRRESIMIMITAACALYMYYMHLRRKALTRHGKTPQQRAAQNPPISSHWLSREPKGLILGKKGQLYYCLPIAEANGQYEVHHLLVIGGSGTGKTSSVYAESIMHNFQSHKPFRFMAVDIKGELHREFCPPVARPSDDKDNDSNPYYLIDPTDREHSYGYDVLGMLSDDDRMDVDKVMQASSDIASAFVKVSGEKDKYFAANALTMLSGFISAAIETDVPYVDQMRRILTEDVKVLIKEMVASTMPGSATRFYLGRFLAKGKDNESLDDIISEMTTALTPFALSSVSYMLKDNPHKICASDIRSKDIVLSVPNDMLDDNTFAPIYRMILIQEQRYLISRIPEPGTPPVVLYYDELYSIGGADGGTGIQGLERFLSIARQYGCCVVAAIQSEQMLVKHYGREGAKIMEDNMVKDILHLSDPDTVRAAKGWTGKYAERDVSVTADKAMKSNISWSQQDIFDGADFASLVRDRKAIVVPLTDGFARVDKSQYFRDPYFTQLQKHIKKGE